MTLDPRALGALREAFAKLDGHFAALPEFEPAHVDERAIARVLSEVADRLGDNYPYFHPLYAGQMLKPPHPIARLAYALATWINPNNHALDGGRASSRMEKEAVADLARMVGWNAHLGHLTSGGTMANLEALWIAGRTRPGLPILASKMAHYTHERISAVLGLQFESVPCDRRGRMDVEALERRLALGEVAAVVVTLGTTAIGSVDPLADVLALRARHGFRLHVDAAYGGYFTLGESLASDARRSFDRLSEVDSIVIDPHKHGLQPYGCGCVLFRDPSVGRYYKHDSPYTYFSSDELHLGEISLECSRPGAAAVALWATHRLFPLERGGEFARALDDSRRAALDLFERLRADARFVTPLVPELDIVVWAVRAPSAREASERAREIFAAAAEESLHLALAELSLELFDRDAFVERDRPTVTCLRSVLMKPEHAQWLDAIWSKLDAATAHVLS